MKVSVFLSTLAASLVLAAPAAEIDRRATTSAYLCVDRGFNGHCAHIFSPSGTCVPLGSDLNDLVSAVGPDPGSFCYFYTDFNCQGDFFHVGNPGYPDLSVTPVNGPPGTTRNFEDKLSSYACFSDSS